MKYSFKNGILMVDDKEVKIPNIQLTDVLGKGANAVCLKGQKSFPERNVAIKVWFARNNIKVSDEERFKAEINKTAKLNSERIVQVYDARIIDNNIYYAELEYIPGITLSKWLKTDRSRKERYTVLKSLLSGVEDCHRNNINLGDLHSDNIMVLENGLVKIIDLGTSVFAQSPEKSLRRGKELLLTTSLQVLFEEEGNKLFLKEILEYPIETIRTGLKILNNFIWEVHINNNDIDGDQMAVIIDLYSKIAEMPIFDIAHIAEYIESIVNFKRYSEPLYNGINYECDIKLGRFNDEERYEYFGIRLSKEYAQKTEEKYKEWVEIYKRNYC